MQEFENGTTGVKSGTLRTKGGNWLTVEAPSEHWGGDIPIHRELDHALLRPYGELLRRGDPNTGRVQYSLGLLEGEDPRVLSALSLREKRAGAPRLITPVDMTIYPGISTKLLHRSNTTEHYFAVHHFSVRETPTGLQVYSHGRTGETELRPAIHKRVRPVRELGGLVNLGQVFAKDWTAFDACGFAAAKIESDIWNARARAGRLSNQGAGSRALLTNLKGSDELRRTHNYLWQGFFLAQRLLSQQDQQDVVRFIGHQVNPRLAVMGPLLDYEGSIQGTISSIPLGENPLAEETYRFLHIITNILPGNMTSNTGMVALPAFLPILSEDRESRPAAYSRIDDFAQDLW